MREGDRGQDRLDGRHGEIVQVNSGNALLKAARARVRKHSWPKEIFLGTLGSNEYRCIIQAGMLHLEKGGAWNRAAYTRNAFDGLTLGQRNQNRFPHLYTVRNFLHLEDFTYVVLAQFGVLFKTRCVRDYGIDGSVR